jgi:hypothetical protein
MGFKAKEAVEALDFDFEGIGTGAKGTIAEPSTGLVNGYMKNMKDLMREANNMRRRAEGLSEESDEEISDEDLEKRMAEMDELEAEAIDFQQRSTEHLAVLCGAQYDEESQTFSGGSPTLEDLQSLPYRHLQAFTQWLTGEIRPKKDRPAGKR